MDFSDAHLDALTQRMKEVETIFQVQLGLQLYLTYGTLLGATRNEDFIGHDVDIDMAYVSRARSAAGVLKERDMITAFFAEFDMIAAAPNHGRFLLRGTTDPDSGKALHGIEIYTSFVTHGAYYCYPCIPGWLTGREIKPFGTAMLRGIEFAVPRQSEAWLASHYGDGWSAPVKPSEYRENPARYACFEFLRTEDT
ncbi:LicD family protein [Shimia sp. W99]